MRNVTESMAKKIIYLLEEKLDLVCELEGISLTPEEREHLLSHQMQEVIDSLASAPTEPREKNIYF